MLCCPRSPARSSPDSAGRAGRAKRFPTLRPAGTGRQGSRRPEPVPIIRTQLHSNTGSRKSPVHLLTSSKLRPGSDIPGAARSSGPALPWQPAIGSGIARRRDRAGCPPRPVPALAPGDAHGRRCTARARSRWAGWRSPPRWPWRHAAATPAAGRAWPEPAAGLGDDRGGHRGRVLRLQPGLAVRRPYTTGAERPGYDDRALRHGHRAAHRRPAVLDRLELPELAAALDLPQAL